MNAESIRYLTRLVAALLATGWTVTAANGASSVSFEWGTQTNASAPGLYFVRGLAVDQSDGDIYVAQAAANGSQATAGSIVKLDSAGNILWTRGPDLRDGSNVVQATIPLNSPAGVAVDPLTGNLHVLIQEPDSTTSVHVLNSSGTWLKKFPTGLPAFTVDSGAAYGGAFSDDGKKYLIAGMLEKLAGSGPDATLLGEDPRGSRYGGKLYVRNDNGTAGDPADDTWTPAAELLDNGEFWMGYQFPKATAFDRLGRAYVGDSAENNTNAYWHSSYVRSYDSAAPYAMNRAIITGAAQWAIDCDAANNIWTAWSRERDGQRYVRCTNGKGIRLLAFRPNQQGGTIQEPEYCAFDRLNNRIVVAGSPVVGAASTEVRVESYTPTLETPSPLRMVKGRVVDGNGDPIPFANVGYRSTAGTDFPANVAQTGFGYWERAVASANGEFTIEVADTMRVVNAGQEDEHQVSFPVVPTASAPGYLSKRIHVRQFGDPAEPDQFGEQNPSEGTLSKHLPDIALDSATSDTISIRVYGKEGIFDPPEEESGLFWVFRGSGSAASAAAGGEPAALLGSLYSGVSGWYSRFLNLLVDDRWMFQGDPDPKTYVTVEYFGDAVLSPGSGDFTTKDTLALEADVSGSTDADRHAPAGEHWKHIITEDPQWESVTFPVENSYYGNRELRGSDLRVNSVPPPGSTYEEGWSRDWIRRVTISRTAPTEGYPLVADIAAAKQQGSGEVVVEGQVITSQWNGNEFYIEQSDRAAGVRVRLTDDWSEGQLSEPLSNMIGRIAHVQGTLQSDPNTGEAEIVAKTFGASSESGVKALHMNGKATLAENGLDPLALKVTVWGLVTLVSSPDSFTLNDGSGDIKVAVDPATGIVLPSMGDFVTVTGIATLEGSTPATATRIVRPWTSGNVTKEAP